MPNLKISKLARELGIGNKRLMDEAKKWGYCLFKPSDTIPFDIADKLRGAFHRSSRHKNNISKTEMYNDSFELINKKLGFECVVFVVDQRCLMVNGIEHKLAVSFQKTLEKEMDNHTAESQKDSKYTFALHSAIINDLGMVIEELWVTSENTSLINPKQALTNAETILQSMVDEEYQELCNLNAQFGRVGLNTVTSLRLSTSFEPSFSYA